MKGKNPIEEVQILRSTLRTAFGPLARMKSYLESKEIVLTSDGYTIARKLGFEGFPFRHLLESMQKHEEKFGDGSTTLGLLASSLYLEFLRLLNDQITPFEIQKELKKIKDEIFKEIDSFSFAADRDSVSKALTNILKTKPLLDFQTREILLECSLKVWENKVNPGDFEICTVQNDEKPLRTIEGILVRKRIFSVFPDFLGSKAILLKNPVEGEPNQLEEFKAKLVLWKVNTVILQETIDSRLEEELAKLEILCIKRIDLGTLVRLSRMIGSRIGENYCAANEDNVGEFGTISVHQFKGDYYLLFTSVPGRPMFETLIIRNLRESESEEIIRIASDLMMSAFLMRLHPLLVPGGGIIEARIINHLNFLPSSSLIRMKVQNAISNAILYLVKSLFSNLPNPNRYIEELLSEREMFFCLEENKLERPEIKGVFEPLVLKKEVYETAFRIAFEILNTDY